MRSAWATSVDYVYFIELLFPQAGQQFSPCQPVPPEALLYLLYNISKNTDKSRMIDSNMATCAGPNLLSTAEKHMLHLEALVQVMRKVNCIYQLGIAFWPTQAFLFRGMWLPPLLNKHLWGSCQEKQSHRSRFPCKSEGQECERLFYSFSAIWVEPNVLMCGGLVRFLIENSKELFGEEMAGLSSAPAKKSLALVVEAETAELCQVHKHCGNMPHA